MPRRPQIEAPEVTQVAVQSTTTVDDLHRTSLESYAGVSSYCARLRRRESPNGQPKPEELVLFKERKSPFSIHFKWIGTVGAGREVLYVKGQHGDKLHVLTASGDVPFIPAGRRMALARDSMLVKAANPNHDIADAGLTYNLRDLGQLYAAAKNPSTGVQAKMTGPVTRPESPKPMQCVEITVPAGLDPDLPRGGRRSIFYCPDTKLPVVYLCYDELNREQNYNSYDRLQLNLRLDDDDFNPEKLWGKVGEPAANSK
ncbi:MAG: DUF1571 domain-containing protein [Gemmataceae bacterium]|nr:DUF1571 domain-containing protein [Gemmataceae bacterium]